MVIEVKGDRMDVKMLRDDGGIEDYFSIVKSGTATVNHAPVVNAGADQSVDSGATLSLDATVSDDGLPSGSTLAVTWSKVSGPGAVSFDDAHAVDTTAVINEAGTYVLKLEASDGELSGSDTVTITVTEPSSGGGNRAPSVDAGADQSVETGATISLDATVSDDGLPFASLTVTWSKVSGPGAVSFGDAQDVDTTAVINEAGTYVLKLEASDGELSGSDTVTITVTEPSSGGDDDDSGWGLGSGSVDGWFLLALLTGSLGRSLLRRRSEGPQPRGSGRA
jgi:hypothetical protein